MTFAADIPGYVQGHRFSDDPIYYDGSGRFFDQSAYSRFGRDVTRVNGTPTFASRGPNARRGLFLDNTNHWQFPHACPWMGSGMIVAELSYVAAGTTSFIPYVFGEASLVTTNPIMFMQHFSGQFRLYVVGGSNFNQQLQLVSNNTIVVFAWSRNQYGPEGRHTLDGVTVPTTAFATRSDGLYVGMGGLPRCRLGNLNGNAASTVTSTTGSLHLFEQHFWDGDILRDHLPAARAFIEDRRAHYGVV